MSIGDRTNAEQVHAQLLDILEKLSTLKTNRTLYNAVTEFVIKTESFIDQASRGDSKALDEARSSIRWMESLYHSSPTSVRRKAPISTLNLPKSTQELLAAIQPPTGWQRIRDVAITSAVTAFVTEGVTLSVLFVLHII